MSGLLKRLQKSKSSRESDISAVLISPDVVEADEMFGDGESQRALLTVGKKVEEAEKLLQDLLAESVPGQPTATPELPAAAKAKQASESEGKDDIGSSSLRVIRRRQQTKDTKQHSKEVKSLPWWLSEGTRTSVQVDFLMSPAVKIVLRELQENPFPVSEYPAVIKRAVQSAAKGIAREVKVTVRDEERAEKELQQLVLGKGPLKALYDDELVTEIFIDHHKSIKVTRQEQTLETPFSFRDEEEYQLFIAATLAGVGAELSTNSPIVDCILDDKFHTRLNAIHPLIAQGGEAKVCIRIPRIRQVTFYDLLQGKVLPATVASWLAEVVGSRMVNILVVGPNGCGKTLMTSALLSGASSDERIITVEDAPEIFSPAVHLEKLITRPERRDGTGGVSLVDLMNVAIQRAPHRIVLGQIVEEESRLFLKALEAGFTGSVATIHADSVVDGLWKFLDAISAHDKAPVESLVRRISRSVNLVLRMGKVEGRPCLQELSEVLPAENGQFRILPLVSFSGLQDGKRRWEILTTDSKVMNIISERGLALRVGPGLSLAQKPALGGGSEISSH